MVTRVLGLAMVLTITLAVTTPALADADSRKITISSNGRISVGGDVTPYRCSTVGRPGPVLVHPFSKELAVREYGYIACKKAGFSVPTGPSLIGTVMETTMVNGSPAPVPIPSSGGPAILLPAAVLLIGSGILTYAILRRR
jgi:hypothetical protein